MQIDEGTRVFFRESSPEQKLQILRHEMITPIAAIQGTAKLLRRMDLRVVEGSAGELEFLLDTLAEAGNHLKDVLDMLTG
jgi:signal transduction histidine kinase